MKEILDEDQLNLKENDNITSNIQLRSIIYSTVMFVGGILYMGLIAGYKPSFYNYVIGSLIVNFPFIVLGGIIAIIRFFFRRFNDNRNNAVIIYDPLWFQILEIGFLWWMFSMFFICVGKFI